ncbi:hypothetical protein BN1051_01995 [Arthrobacter saudimassiliensis]|uniref:Polysaccharide biosynthesis protein n=1 Tax=Arthrobacter saudimassiliensis TaxID=1461584 RepID=A0A078MN28_9MICC|nr:hypothetical protein BN1051_01995 [Arthrobacter saudimassiliensis]
MVASEETGKGAIGARGLSGVGAASLLSALSGFVILFVVARVLSPAENSEFLAYWGALFAVYGILFGVIAETTRAVGRAELDREAPMPEGAGGRPRGASVVGAALIVGAGLAALVAAVGFPFADQLFGSQGTAIVALLAVSCLFYAWHAAIAGSLQGLRLWQPYTKLVTMEALFRLLAVVTVALASGTLFGIELACLAALAAAPVLFSGSRSARAASRARADIPMAPFLRQTGQALISAASSAALLVSFPILVKVTTAPDAYELAAPLLLAISLTRAPIMLPLQAFQGVAISAVLRARDEGAGAVRRPIGAVLAAGVIGAALAWLIGPWLMLLFGPDYLVAGWVLAALTLDAALIALLTLSGTALLALGRHRVYALGWLLATVVAVGFLLIPDSTELRCILSLTVGPLCGIVLHFAALLRGDRSERRVRDQ